KDPPRRYPSAAELADDLRRFLDREPIRARPISTPERLAKWARREPALAALVSLGCLAVTGLVIGILAHNARLKAEVERAEANALAARREQQRADLNYQKAHQTIQGMMATVTERNLPDVPRVTRFLLE